MFQLSHMNEKTGVPHSTSEFCESNSSQSRGLGWGFCLGVEGEGDSCSVGKNSEPSEPRRFSQLLRLTDSCRFPGFLSLPILNNATLLFPG